MKKKILKGFTLVELIVVMAIFSILMVGAMSLVGPVSKIFKHTNTLEKTYSYVNNIKDYLQDSLQYADNIWVFQGDRTQEQLSQDTFDFKEAFYNDIIGTADGSSPGYTDCTIRVMTILNKDTEIGGTTYEKGQILMQDVTYNSNAAARIVLNPCQKQLNDTFFADNYDYDYVLGSSGFVDAGDDMVMLESMNPDNAGYIPGEMNPENFAIGIVTYYSNDAKDRNGILKPVTETANINDSRGTGLVNDGNEYNYRKYDSSSQYNIATIPLMNIIERGGQLNKSYYVYGTKDDGSTDYSKAESYNNGTAIVFDHNPTNITMSCDDNIYIVYALTNEVNIP